VVDLLVERFDGRLARLMHRVSASHAAAAVVMDRVSLQSRMSLRSAKYQRPSILAKVSR
jgi:hypothetical protein